MISLTVVFDHYCWGSDYDGLYGGPLYESSPDPADYEPGHTWECPICTSIWVVRRSDCRCDQCRDRRSWRVLLGGRVPSITVGSTS